MKLPHYVVVCELWWSNGPYVDTVMYYYSLTHCDKLSNNQHDYLSFIGWGEWNSKVDANIPRLCTSTSYFLVKMQNWLSNFHFFSFQFSNFQFCQFSLLTFNFCQFKTQLQICYCCRYTHQNDAVLHVV